MKGRRRREVSREPCKLCTRCRVRESPKIPSRASWQEPPIASLISPGYLILAVSLHVYTSMHKLLERNPSASDHVSLYRTDDVTLVMSSLPARDDVGRWRTRFARARWREYLRSAHAVNKMTGLRKEKDRYWFSFITAKPGVRLKPG